MLASDVQTITPEICEIASKTSAMLARQIDQFPFGSTERAIAQQALDNSFVPNVKECDFCHGTVDRWGAVIQCRDCGAIGDKNTFIMEPPRE